MDEKSGVSNAGAVPAMAPPAYGAIDGQPGSIGQPPYYGEPPPKYEPPGAGGPDYTSEAHLKSYSQGQQEIIIQNIQFGPHPCTLSCPFCGAMVTTTVTYGAGCMAWLLSGILCFLGCWMGCCLIPFCITDLQDAKHTCPNCYRRLGDYHRL